MMGSTCGMPCECGSPCQLWPGHLTATHRCDEVINSMTKTHSTETMDTTAPFGDGPARKSDQDKVTRPELVPYDLVDYVGRVLAFGAKKYSPWNWAKGFDWSRLIGAAERHLGAFKNGEDTDPESGLPHLAHLACCVTFLLVHQLRGLGTDDRYKWPPVKG